MLFHLQLSCNHISIRFYFLSILPPSSCDYLCLPASLFCVHQTTSFIYIIVPGKLFLCDYFFIHFVSSALLHDSLRTDLVISFSVCVWFIIQPVSCISVIAFVADSMPVSFFSIHPSLMNSYLHHVGTLQPLSYMCLIALSFTAYRYDWMNHIKMLKITSGSIFTV